MIEFILTVICVYIVAYLYGHRQGVKETEKRWSDAVAKLDDRYDYTKQFEAQYDTSRKDSDTN